MALAFPNASRSYARPKGCVSFWGYDASFEITFDVDIEALRRISPETVDEETSLLRAFDSNRDRIEKIASAAYARKRRSYLRLAAADF